MAWSLAWCENGELAPQDRFDLLQTLIASESMESQPALIAAVERMAIANVSIVGTMQLSN